MGLGIQTANDFSDRLPIVKYDARAGRLTKVDRTEEGGTWVSRDTDITNAATFVMDLATIETGWICFADGKPDIRMAPLGTPPIPRPSEAHKQGFRVRIYSPKILGGVREFSHAAKVVIGSIDELHTRFEAAPESKQGKLPVVTMTGTLPVKTSTPQGTTTNYAPQFVIAKWIDRPADLLLPADKPAVAQPAAVPQAAPATNGTRHVGPPPPAAPVQTVAQAEDEFGAMGGGAPAAAQPAMAMAGGEEF